MVRPNFPLSINRRRLLTSSVAATAAGIVLLGHSAETGAAQAVIEVDHPPSFTPEVRPRNVSAATARRLLEIARRNEIRQEAGLPVLSIPKELRRMKELEGLQAFEAFAAAHRKAAWDEVLKSRRETRDHSNWQPSWMERLALQNEVNQLLRQRYYAAPDDIGSAQ